jgi:hypothetical protein
MFSPVRFGGNNFLKKRHFIKVKENGRTLLRYSGRAAIVVGKSTPLIFDYNVKQEKLTLLCSAIRQGGFFFGFKTSRCY